MENLLALPYPGRISGARDSVEFKRSIRTIRNDPNAVELTLFRIELDEATLSSIRRVMLSRKWKSIAIHHCSDRVDEVIQAALEHAVRVEFSGGVEEELSRAISFGLRSDDCYTRKFCFNGANISLAGAAILAEGLRSCRALQEFALTNCRPSSDIITLLLGSNTRLRALYLCDCFLEEENVAQIAQKLSCHPFLKQLWLNGKQSFGQEGALLLLEALKTHVELEHMQLPRTFDCTAKIQEYMELNRSGRRLLGDPSAPLALWPLVLERVGRISGLTKDSRANILYFFVNQLHGRERLRL